MIANYRGSGEISGSAPVFREGKEERKDKETRKRVGLKTKPEAEPKHENATIPVHQMMQFEKCEGGGKRGKDDVMPNSALETDTLKKGSTIAAVIMDRKKKKEKTR